MRTTAAPKDGRPGMIDREWIQATLEHRAGERVPYNFMFSPPARQVAEDLYGADLEASLDLPLRMTGLKSVTPLYADPDEYGDTVTDEFGVVWSTNRVDRGAPIGPCLPEPDLSSHTFPDPHAAYRYEDIGEWCARQQGHYRIIWVGDLWERATFMRGMEALLMDVALNPTFVEELLGRLTDRILATASRLLEGYDFEAIALSDDYGAQQGMVMSPTDWRRLIRPRLAEIYGLAKECGRAVFHHSCGHITPIVGDLIDLGLDILHPIQPEAMDIQALKREYGRDVTFCGGIPTQQFLACARPDEVRREVARLKQQMGKGGGYILEPGITIQADVPRGNIAAMVEACRAEG